MMRMRIPLAKPFFDESENQEVKEVLNSGMVSQGKVVEEFEEVVRRYVGAKYAVAVSSCTAGLYLTSLEMEGMRYNRNWIVPAFTFPAINKIREYVELPSSPFIQMIDVDKNTYNLDTHELDKLGISSMIVPIHQFGLPCEMGKIRRCARENETHVLEDAACALGSEYMGEKIGRRGTAVFSFHGRKIITTGEGGMVVTDDEEIYEAVSTGRQFGKNKDGKFIGNGMNFKMSDIQAAIGIAQMGKIYHILKQRDIINATYNITIRAELGEKVRTPDNGGGRNNQSYVVRLKNEINRNEVIRKMREMGIECQVGSYDNSNGNCKVSAELARTTLALPIWAGMTAEQVIEVVEGLKTCVQ